MKTRRSLSTTLINANNHMCVFTLVKYVQLLKFRMNEEKRNEKRKKSVSNNNNEEIVNTHNVRYQLTNGADYFEKRVWWFCARDWLLYGMLLYELAKIGNEGKKRVIISSLCSVCRSSSLIYFSLYQRMSKHIDTHLTKKILN